MGVINQEEVLLAIKDVLECDDLNDLNDLDRSLDEYDWDSIAIIGLLSSMNDKFNVILDPKKIADAKTIRDLLVLVETTAQ